MFEKNCLILTMPWKSGCCCLEKYICHLCVNV